MPRIEISQFSVEDLGKMRLFITKKGRPTSDMTDSIWQEIFERIKENTVPFINGEKKRMDNRISKATVNEWGEYEVDQTSDWTRYCNFINDVLRDIRTGNKSVCFFYYQISQLLKFHKDDLRTRYDVLNQQWEVWLDGSDKN